MTLFFCLSEICPKERITLTSPTTAGQSISVDRLYLQIIAETFIPALSFPTHTALPASLLSKNLHKPTWGSAAEPENFSQGISFIPFNSANISPSPKAGEVGGERTVLSNHIPAPA